MARTAVFDLDGTLADTSRDLIAAANACFADAPLDPVADAGLAFRGGRAMLREGFRRRGGAWDEADVDRTVPRFLTAYEAWIDRETRLYPAVAETLDDLRRADWTLAVCTNKPARLAEILLDRLAIRDRFAAVLGADTLPVRKPDPRHLLETIVRAGGNATRAALIGDTVTDRDAAKNARVPCILVTFGPHGAAVRDLEPEGTIASYAGLPGELDRLVP